MFSDYVKQINADLNLESLQMHLAYFLNSVCK